MASYRAIRPICNPIALTFVTYNALQLCLYAKQTRGGYPQGYRAIVIQKQTAIHDSCPPRRKAQKNTISYRKCTFLQKNALSYSKMRFPAERCTFLQKNAGLGGHMAGNHRKSQDGCRAQESRTLANFHKI